MRGRGREACREAGVEILSRHTANAISPEQLTHLWHHVRWPGRRLALGVLRRLTCLLQARLLPFLDPGVPGQEAKALQRRAARRIDEYQRPGDSQPQRARLAGDAAACDPRDDVELILSAERHKRLVDELLVHLIR